MNIVVTGACGYIGKHVISTLCKKHHVVAIDKMSDAPWRDKNITYVSMDLTKRDIASDIFSNVDVVIHLAGTPFDSAHLQDMLQSNVMPTDNLLQLCVKQKISRVLLASSVAVYGEGEKKFQEDDVPAPFSYYGLSKLMMEELGRFYATKYGLHTIILRLASVYGPGNTKGLIHDLLRSIDDTNTIQLRGSGEQKRNSLFIDDCVHAITTIVESDKSSGYSVYNVAGRDDFSVNELVKIIAKYVMKKFEVHYTGVKQQNALLHIEKMEQEYQWRPSTSLLSGLQQVVKHCNENQ